MTTENPREVIIMKVPKVIIRHMCLTPFLEHDHNTGGEVFFLILKALYGLDQSPRDWGIERDRCLEEARVTVAGVSCRLKQSRVDSNVWLLLPVVPREREHIRLEPLSFLLVYIDDFLALAPRPVAELLLDLVSSLWKCGKALLRVNQCLVKSFGLLVGQGLMLPSQSRD